MLKLFRRLGLVSSDPVTFGSTADQIAEFSETFCDELGPTWEDVLLSSMYSDGASSMVDYMRRFR